MICVDNSEWMRNGDYSPSRMEAIQDAANLISNAKMQSNPENTVGIMSLAGRNPELLVSPTDDMGKIMTSIHEMKIAGSINFADGVQVAYLALKHRRNKHGGQRVVLFVGSPVTDDSKVLKKVAGNLKKNNVSHNPALSLLKLIKHCSITCIMCMYVCFVLFTHSYIICYSFLSATTSTLSDCRGCDLSW